MRLSSHSPRRRRVAPAKARAALVSPILALALMLQGCGGGGGSTPEGGSAGSPPPVAAPPAAPPLPPAMFPPAPFGLTIAQQLPLFGWVYREGSSQPTPAEPAIVDLSWSPAARTYQLSLAGIGSGNLRYTFPGNNPVAFSLIDSGGTALPVSVTLDPDGASDGPLQHAGVLWMSRQDQATAGELARAELAFGFPTTTSQVPTSGRAGYELGQSHSGADLRFDFSAGTLQGFVRIAWVDAWGPYEPVRYDLTDTQYGRGATTFSARFTVAGAPSQGLIEGRFLGPNASELVVRWHGPIRDPYTDEWTTMSGVWLGRPYCADFVNRPCA